jgi:hypothetical protein
MWQDVRVAYYPNRFSLGYPRYHGGLLEPGWCDLGWWDILWDPAALPDRAKFIQRLS